MRVNDMTVSNDAEPGRAKALETNPGSTPAAKPIFKALLLGLRRFSF